jgi:hypothetical protein
MSGHLNRFDGTIELDLRTPERTAEVMDDLRRFDAVAEVIVTAYGFLVIAVTGHPEAIREVLTYVENLPEVQP